MIVMIAVIAEKKKSSVISAIIAIIWKTLSSDRSDHMETRLKPLRGLQNADIVISSAL